MHIRILFLISFILISMLMADDPEHQPPPVPVHLQAIPIGAFNSLGFSNGLFVIPADIADANPASLSHFQKFAAGFRMNYFTSINLYDIATFKKPKIWLPTAAGLVYPYGSFHLGIAYHQKYAYRLDSGDIPVITPSQPEGTGETMRIIQDAFVYSFSGMASYGFRNLFSNGDLFSIGAQISADYFTMDESVLKTKIWVHKAGWSWEIGALYRWNRYGGVSVFYEKGIDITGELEIKYAPISGEPNEPPGLQTMQGSPYTLRLPDKLSLGFLLTPFSHWTFSASPTLIYWNQINKYYENNWDISANTIYRYNDRLAFSLGYYHTNKRYQEAFTPSSIKENATFLDAAVRMRIKNYQVILEVLDSHWFSAEQRKQTILKVSLNYLRK